MIDRQAIAVLKATLMARLGLGDADYGLLVTCFLAGYAAAFIVSGWLVDRFGSRLMLTLFIAVWSLAAVMTGFAHTMPELAIYRTALGIAQAGLTPATVYAFVRWFPKERLATAYSLRSPIVALGPILATPVIVALVLGWGWHAAFVVPGLAGLALAAAWWLADRNAPGDAAELEPRTRSPIRRLLGNRLLWALIAARLVSDPLWFFIQHWQVGYFQEVVGLDLTEVGALLWLPPLVSALLAVGAGMTSDRMLRAGQSVVQSRVRVMQALAFLAPLAAAIPFVGGAPAAIALFTLVQFMCLSWLILSNVLLTALVDKGSVATASGLMNAVGTAGAMIFSAFTGQMVEQFGYAPVFGLAACFHPIAAVILFVAYRHAGRRGDVVDALPDGRQ